MDKYRQQNSRNQRNNTRNCYQQNANYGYQSSRNMTMDCGCNQYSMNDNACGCNQAPMQECPEMVCDPLKGMAIAMAYVPWQRFENLYQECEAVYHGTIFCDLDKGFYGVRCE